MDHAVLETERHRYAVVSWLAEGGMGAIYRGRRLDARPGSVEEEVVLKQLLPEHTKDPKLIEMFLREARLSASLSHKNIVKTLDLVNAGDDYYIVMEHVRGGDLRAILRRAKRRQKALSIESCLFIVAEVLSALGYAHDKVGRDGSTLGLIHRDVSPSNVLLGDRGEVKLTDFGIAKIPTQGSVVFKVKGKVGYMAPEQARGEPVDRRVDLFAAGVVLYELLVGERLFVGNALSPAAVVFAQPVTPPSRKRADLPSELDAVVMRALALDRNHRYSSASEMRDALLSLLTAMTRGRLPSERTLADDLRRVCGDDASLWRNLDVAPQATLDGAAQEGTGVIATDDAGDAFDDRPSSVSRAVPLPARELTSVVRLRSAQNLEAPTQLADDPFAVTQAASLGHAATAPAFAPLPREGRASDFDEAQTRVADGPNLRMPPPSPRPTRTPLPAPLPRAPVAQGPRVTFEPIAPRPVVPPPDSIEAESRSTFRDAPTRLSSSQPLQTLPPSSASSAPSTERVTLDKGQITQVGSTPRTLETARSHSTSIQLLDKALRGRTTTRLVLTIIGLVILVALGVGLGVILSGERPPPIE